MIKNLQSDLKKLADPQRGKFLAGFFKTGPGQYAEGDVFCGVSVPESRKIALRYKDLSFAEINILLHSKIHEERLIALLILVHKFTKADETMQKKIFDFYLAHTAGINNWDLVDLSADKIVGEYLYKICHPEFISGSKNKEIPDQVRNDKTKVLVSLAHSKNLWERRIAIIATFAFIKNGKEEPTFTIADILLHDNHDLIQKAVGWMLREVGKRVSLEKEEAFLRSRYKSMPRTALRYAIERFPEDKRKKYLAGTI